MLVLVLKKSNSKEVFRAAVVTNGYGCANIGTAILEKGGNAVDAAIAALFCEGVSMPQSMGLGGGFLMTIYNRTTGETWSLNARETAPANATEDMYHSNPILAHKGGLSVAVPGELRGYWQLYNTLGGGVPWKDLIQPTIDICENGIYVTTFSAGVFKEYKNLLYADPILRESFINATNNETYVEGQYVHRKRLAKTLRIIADEGGEALYTGSLATNFIKDITSKGGIVTLDDMKNYEPQMTKALTIQLPGNQTLHTSPLPGSGPVLAYIMNLLNIGNISEMNTTSEYQYIVESFKFGYGYRTQFGDPNFFANDSMAKFVEKVLSMSFAEETKLNISLKKTSQNPEFYGAKFSTVEDHGTANLEVISKEGDAVSVTSTINLIFGAGFASESTGIILNDQMDDFSSPNITNTFGLPPSPANFIKPGKRPLSSMCPSIITDENGDVILAIGAAGGSKITTAIALTVVNHLWYGMDIKSAIDKRRFHHQLFPMQIIYENDFQFDAEGKKIIESLHNIGHNYTFIVDQGFAAVTAISKSDGTLHGAFDRRRSGSISYIK